MIDEHNFVFVTGKGGVGKTTFALALTLALSEKRARKVLFCEWGKNNQSSIFWGKKIKPYERKRITERISVFRIDPERAMEEYVKRRFRSPLLYYPFLKSKIWKGFSRTTPALRESVIIGKIWDIIYGEGALKDIDTLIFDGPSTGVAKGMLQIPQKMRETFFAGPMKKEAQKLIDLIDSKKTLYAVVTYGEELSVDETIEFVDFINPRKFWVVFNRFYDFKEIEKMNSVKDKNKSQIIEYYLFRKELIETQLRRLQNYTPLCLSNIFEAFDFRRIVVKLSEQIKEVL